MRAHLALGPRRSRAPITVFVPHGHPMHRADRRAGEPSASVQSNRQTATAAALVCALGLLSAALLAGIQREESTSAAGVPWQSAVPVAVAAGTPPMLPAAPNVPVLMAPAVALPVPHFIHLPYRIRP